jgi:hypothetical protein
LQRASSPEKLTEVMLNLPFLLLSTQCVLLCSQGNVSNGDEDVGFEVLTVVVMKSTMSLSPAFTLVSCSTYFFDPGG